MLYLFLWLLCTLAAAYVYREKNRPWVWGALAGLILGPIGVILALLTSRVPLSPAMKTCPKCGARAGVVDRFCPSCGADIHYA